MKVKRVPEVEPVQDTLADSAESEEHFAFCVQPNWRNMISPVSSHHQKSDKTCHETLTWTNLIQMNDGEDLTMNMNQLGD